MVTLNEFYGVGEEGFPLFVPVPCPTRYTNVTIRGSGRVSVLPVTSKVVCPVPNSITKRFG